MDMFDSVLAVNISDKTFKHNGILHQTKSLGCSLSQYIIFNGQLWQQYDGSGEGEQFELAVQVDYSGVMNINTLYTSNQKTCWIEYNLTFEGGKLVGVQSVGE